MAAENDRRQRADDNYKRLRKQLDERLKADEKLRKIAEKIKQGKADFKDTSEYSKIISEHLGKIISENIGEINNPMGKELVCKALLEDNYELINGVLGEVQASVDEKMGVHIKPQKAPFPAERVMKAAHSLEDKTVPVETIKRRAKSASTNVSMSFHDDYMKANADFRSNAGLTCYITRTDSGKCCDWCSKVAGRYVYGKEPADIFRRHDNCKCSVIYENGRQRQDVWSKRTWEQPANPEPYEPTVLSPDEAKEIQQRKLEGYKGLTKPPKESKIEESEDSKEKKPTVLSPEQAKEIQREKLNEYKGLAEKNEEEKSEEVPEYAKGSSDFSDEAKVKLYRDERILTGNRYETAILYDETGNVENRKKGNADSVHFTEKEIKTMKGKILTHNHPNGSTFSSADINMLRRADLAEIRACSRRGTYIMRRPKNWSKDIPDFETIDIEYHNIYERIGKEYRDKAAREGKNIVEYLGVVDDKTIEEFCKKYDIEFHWESALDEN